MADLKGPARQAALRVLGRRMRTAREMRKLLAGKGHAEREIEAVVARLEEDGYLNDREFAHQWVALRSAHRLYGPVRLAMDLRNRGVAEEFIQEALGERLGADEEMALARKAARKKLSTLRAGGQKGRAALYRHLHGRGFTAPVITAVLADLRFEEDTS